MSTMKYARAKLNSSCRSSSPNSDRVDRPAGPGRRAGSAARTADLAEAVDDLADQVGALVAEEQARQHLDLEVGAQARSLTECRRAARRAPGRRSRSRSSNAQAQLEVDDDAQQRVAQRVAGGVVGAVGRLRRGSSFSMYSVDDRRPHEDEVVVEVAAVQDLGGDRVEEGLGQLGLVVVDQQADVVQLDLLPAAVGRSPAPNSPLQRADRLAARAGRRTRSARARACRIACQSAASKRALACCAL